VVAIVNVDGVGDVDVVGDGRVIERSLTFCVGDRPEKCGDRAAKRVAPTTADDPDHVFSITMPSPTTFTSPTPTTFTSPTPTTFTSSPPSTWD
jgi:hypothetical protein